MAFLSVDDIYFKSGEKSKYSVKLSMQKKSVTSSRKKLNAFLKIVKHQLRNKARCARFW